MRINRKEKNEEGERMEERIEKLLKSRFGRGMDRCTKNEIFDALMQLTREELKNRPQITGKKKLYYISAEFLIGKLLSNNLINLGLYGEVDAALKKHKLSLREIEEMEMEPSLGNGGLGRLAACFLDSIATLGLPGDGVGLNYHFGLFRQQFVNNKQRELKNPWISQESWLTRREVSFQVPFRQFTLQSCMYDIDVPGYGGKGCNRLHLFDLDTVDDGMVGNDGINFDKKDIQRNLTLFLYPDDSDVQGQLLRIYQQYFMVSNAAQLILMECAERGVDLHRMDEYVVIQINDTHPSLVIPELIRLLQKRGFTLDEAIQVVSRTCAYTNHTILAEALEKWPLSYLEQTVPHLLPIIWELDARVREKYEDKSVYLIDEEKRVHMANMDIHYGFSVNGVAALHTEILKKAELKNFYRIYPEKFNNKTNGITFRRWLLHCNPRLTELIRELIGTGFEQDAMELEKLLAYQDDRLVLEKLGEVKRKNKRELSRYLYETQNLDVDENSIFDVQIKRLHEYKRQQMNALYAIYKYREIKAGRRPAVPVTMIFGAKAAPAYTIAKDIIHLILCLQQLIARDPEISPWFRVVMAENYNVTKASHLIPAADISEQISLASKEASGTGNMKFMLNGAVTLGTEDGANVEIHELVGDDNIYIFGKKTREVIRLYEEKGYRPGKYYEGDPLIRELVDFVISEEVMELGDPVSLERLHHELITKDWFMTLLDLEEYIRTKEKAYADYADRDAWNRKALVNIAKAGYFSSDRTIAQYNEDIWHLN
jgi:starch phosphorylase